jgi:hypothetical protein
MNDLKSEKEYRIFRSLWWLVNLLVLVTLLCTIWTGNREYSVRRYLSGFSDAIIPQADPPQEKVEAMPSLIGCDMDRRGLKRRISTKFPPMIPRTR